MPRSADIERTLGLGERPEPTAYDTFPLPITLNGRYELHELLGAGGMGVVYRATDLVSGREVALKTLRDREVSPTALALFKAEFMTLSTLSHPNIAAVHDFARRHDSAECFFTMELVHGRGAIEATHNATLEQILSLALQVLRALSYLHARSVIHFDLKPANIMITSDGQVRLLDFGVARSAHSRPRGLYATPIYMAPEVRSGGEVDRRADLYSFGVTLFQLVFRRVPASQAALEANPEVQDFELTPAERAQVPTWLPPILQRLVERDPARRFRTANEVISALNRARGVDDAIETDQTSDSYVASAALVGREDAFETLLDHVQRRARGGRQGPIATLCVGPSGSGKSRLLRELRHQCQLARHLVFEANCYAEAREPYAAWCDIIGHAATSLERPAEPHLAVIQKLAPATAARLGSAPERRAMHAHALAEGVVELLLATNLPALVSFSDVEWIDAPSLELLELVLERCASLQRQKPVRLAFLLSARGELADPLAAMLGRLRSAQGLLEVPLLPLDSRQVGELVASMLGATNITPPLSQALTDATHGNALLVAEVLRAWVRDGRLSPQPSGWTFRVSAGAAEIAEQVERLWRDRLTELAPLELQLLRLLAVFGRPLTLSLLSAAVDADAKSALAAVAELRRRELVLISRDELVHVTNPRFAEAVGAAIESNERMALHLRLADALALEHDAARAALHYQRGANLVAAAEQYAVAASQSFERGELSRVLEHAEMVAACGASGAALGRVASLAAEAARLCGDPRAADYARQALTLLAPGSSEWLQASRVAIAVFNPLAKDQG
ncbi:MAG: protein kinase domain-containing protein [Myxococcota bacterium]